MKAEKRKRPRPAALDILIIILIVLCFAGIGIRTAVGENGLFSDENAGAYNVSFTVSGKNAEHNAYFKNGTAFYLESGEALGKVTGETSSVPSAIYSENSKGEFVYTLAADGTIDIKGTLTVQGRMTKSGLLLNSGTYISPNMTLTVSSADITVEMLITGVTQDK